MAHPLRIDLIVGARPNFVKVAPIFQALRKFAKKTFHVRLVHTGQHYDYVMSKSFFEDLKIPSPDIYLGVGSGPHGYQTGKIMIEYEKVLLESPPDLVVVFGDVNSTVAAALVATKMGIPVAHVEAGLRSFDWSMPEEINRVLTDRISAYLFTTEESAVRNLESEGIPNSKIHPVGNIIIDTLLVALPYTEKSDILERLNIKKGDYAVLTLHRPYNVDSQKRLKEILDAIQKVSQKIPIVFPVHPRTSKRMKEFGLHLNSEIIEVEPLSYLSFLTLERFASFVLTDSGGIQEESTFLGIPCLTLRKNTERPVTVELGSNVVVGSKGDDILRESLKILNGKKKDGKIPPLWDGKTAERILEVFLKFPPKELK